MPNLPTAALSPWVQQTHRLERLTVDMKNPSATRVAITLLCIALFAAACGSSDVSDSASDSAAADEAEPTEAATSETEDQATVEQSSEDEPAPQTDDSSTGTDEGTETGTAVASAAGANIDLFFDGALAEEVTVEDCTLSNGTASTCYRITVVGAPADHEIGPFCPTTIESSADEGGIWFDGNGLYDLDGDFIVGLPELYDDSNWMLYDEDGNVNITETAEAFDAAARPNVAEEYQNHCVEGQIAWLDNGEPVASTVIIPTEPALADSPSQSRQGLGVTLNGVTIAPAAPVDAILGAYTIAAFDDCGGHINPVDGYHLHGAVGCGEVEVEGHEAIFGYALDGFAIHSPSEDGTVYEDLDSCGGHTTDELGYHYHASPAADNAVIGCLSGATAS